MNPITINLPEDVRIDPFEIKMLVATNLFKKGVLTSGQSAEMVGLTKRAFLEILGNYNVSVFGYEFNELEDELTNA